MLATLRRTYDLRCGFLRDDPKGFYDVYFCKTVG
jgi:hypothetical protein